MPEATFERQYRTPYSEGFLLLEGEDRIGRADLHYTSSIVYCTLIVERELEEEDLLDLIEQIDDEVVFSAGVPRDDFVVTTYQGRELGVYEDEFFDEEDEEDEDEEEELGR